MKERYKSARVTESETGEVQDNGLQEIYRKYWKE